MLATWLQELTFIAGIVGVVLSTIVTSLPVPMRVTVGAIAGLLVAISHYKAGPSSLALPKVTVQRPPYPQSPVG
jgi:hypothetical protein